MNQDIIIYRISLLAALRVLSIQNIQKAPYSEEREAWRLVEDLEDNTEGMVLLSSSLGLSIDKEDIYGGVKNADALISMLLDSCLTDDSLIKKIDEIYGEIAVFSFIFVQTFFIIRIFSSILQYLDIRTAPKRRKKMLKEEKEKGWEFLNTCSPFYDNQKDLIQKLFGDQVAEATKVVCIKIKSSTVSCEKAKEIFNATENIVNSILPQYPDIIMRLDKARVLKKNLEKCKPGKKEWKTYENICFDILRFLFVPPFKKIMAQIVSSSNQERRDAILPNNQHTGFWNLIQQEFNARHIICEFKNGTTDINKNSLNQLRIYLSKPTIGRFGLLFIRNEPTKSLLQAQKDAYEQNQILILIINDEKFKKMLIAKAFLGYPEEILEDEKVNFEVLY